MGVLSGWQYSETTRIRNQLEATPHLRAEIDAEERQAEQAGLRAVGFAGTAVALGTAAVFSLVLDAARERKRRREATAARRNDNPSGSPMVGDPEEMP